MKEKKYYSHHGHVFGEGQGRNGRKYLNFSAKLRKGNLAFFFSDQSVSSTLVSSPERVLQMEPLTELGVKYRRSYTGSGKSSGKTCDL